eukprot:TRINITY_DN19263_c0_g1_i1.p1 TRINITY_DN19263_c0_g1~~TRINITY_DN19263_c0_g1_i1.p1  ORF type:complete len:219 (+),score=57.59 TRINITY_DN19263_c0_g1_i1:92-748(+)
MPAKLLLVVLLLYAVNEGFARDLPQFLQQYSCVEAPVYGPPFGHHVDGPNNRERLDFTDGTYALLLYTDGVADVYSIGNASTSGLRDLPCYHYQLNGTVTTLGWPKGSTYVGRQMVNGTLCEEWVDINRPIPPWVYFWNTPTTPAMPVRWHYEIKWPVPSEEGTTWLNFTYGVPDPSLFVIPAWCDQQGPLDTPELPDKASTLAIKQLLARNQLPLSA